MYQLLALILVFCCLGSEIQAVNRSILHENLDEDAYKFVTRVEKWVNRTSTTKFHLEYKSKLVPKEIASGAEECIDYVLSTVFSHLNKLLDHPEQPHLSIEEAKSMAWHPQQTCLPESGGDARGGSFAGFVITCEDEIIVKAGGGGFGFVSHARDETYTYGGSFIGVEFIGKLRVGGVVTTGTDREIELLRLPKSPSKTVKEVHEKLQQCPSLEIRGGGGTWAMDRIVVSKKKTEKKMVPQHTIGFGFQFQLSTKTSALTSTMASELSTMLYQVGEACENTEYSSFSCAFSLPASHLKQKNIMEWTDLIPETPALLTLTAPKTTSDSIVIFPVVFFVVAVSAIFLLLVFQRQERRQGYLPLLPSFPRRC